MRDTGAAPGALAGQTALVTGASRGIGRAIALRLARAGSDVVGVYFTRHEEADRMAAEVRALGRRAILRQASVGSPESVAELFASLEGEVENIDVLVSNAASGVLRPILESSVKHWRWCLETNALALALLAQHAVPRLRAGARVIALSSLGASRAMPGYGFVGPSKAALEALVRALALELGPRGIRVNAVTAGPVDTDALRAFPEREAILARFLERSPLATALTPGDVADVVYLLCLPEAAMVHGQTIVVDGGASIVA